MHPADQVKQGRFARPIGTDDRMNPSVRDAQRDFMEGAKAIEVFNRFPDFEEHPFPH
jgi:hypothetical protein